ncbi:Zn-dependent hydrolase [Pseudacidovorax sp. RU35E]|uniref:Zn-dependent hydrolase n=1 Tax=Pseudacidovorax sp. RU35E TaxID=1907403 RepID=UPI0009573AB3|nr:Zn-dependent hydrolase [Pseudacidovorax sp. RU35E]SIR63499.1 N-carbamoyl-L-amino-acid hydrolase [Pseudacidovorax sp. RU35E]
MTASSSDARDLHVDGARLWDSLMTLARVGATPRGGVARLALTDLDRQGRDLVVQWGREAGLAITVDQIGNVFMRRQGRASALPPVVAGSHIDTQPTGGKFDGNYGVLAALEVVRTLNDAGVQTEAPIEVVFWTNEEGSRFVPVMMGSGVFAGAIALEDAWAARDLEGRTVREELARIGYLGQRPPRAHPIGAYFEVHIEQGPLLEAAGLPIGVVTGTLGVRWFDCTVTGMEAHAGPTPMALRRDAMQGASALMQEVIAIAHRHPPQGRGTVGMVQVFPNSRNVIPGRVTFSVDLRNDDDAVLDDMARALQEAADRLARASGLQVALTPVSSYPAQPFDRACIALIERSARTLGLPCQRMTSGAGHDAVYTARRAPTGMIFIPCKDGISHNEIEDAAPHHVEAGANVLLHTVLASARPC